MATAVWSLAEPRGLFEGPIRVLRLLALYRCQIDTSRMPGLVVGDAVLRARGSGVLGTRF
jgi:hypothetical protein